MSTLLDQSSQPLWVWIVVIVIGSLLVLGTGALLIRCAVTRRRTRLEHNFVSDEPAEKKLTLRRGRTVPATSYLSLTGSRFGMSSYAAEEGLQSPSVRSKSPFEWWASIRGRSSRLSYVSHVSSSQYPASPRTGSFYQRGDYSVSKGSLTSKDESIRATVTEVKITRPQATLTVPSYKRSSRSFEPVNFSRAFTSQAQRSLAASRNQTLSRIEESTPRHSVYSVASFKHVRGSQGGAIKDSGLVVTDAPPPSRPVSGATLLNLPQAVFTHSRSASAVTGHEPTVFHQQPDQHSPSLSTSPYLSSSPVVPEHAVSSYLESPRTRTQSIWGSSMPQFPWLEDHHHHNHHQHHDDDDDDDQDPDANPYAHSPFHYTHAQDDEIEYESPQALPPSQTTFDPQQRQQQLESNSLGLGLNLPPQTPTVGVTRTRSKKGNVLRKKSLRHLDP